MFLSKNIRVMVRKGYVYSVNFILIFVNWIDCLVCMRYLRIEVNRYYREDNHEELHLEKATIFNTST